MPRARSCRRNTLFSASARSAIWAQAGQKSRKPIASHATLASASTPCSARTSSWAPRTGRLRRETRGDVGYYSKRGAMFGPSGSYSFSADPDSLRGVFRSGFIADHGNERPPARPAGARDSRLRGVDPPAAGHRQSLPDRGGELLEGLTNPARLSGSDEFFKVQEPDTYVESATAAGLLRVAFRPPRAEHFELVQQRLPELRFDLVPFALGSGILPAVQRQCRGAPRGPPLGGTVLRSDRLDATTRLTRPFNPATGSISRQSSADA